VIVGMGPWCPLADIQVTLSLVSASIFCHLHLNTFGSRLAVVVVLSHSSGGKYNSQANYRDR
jgi:hypothetical protein